MNQRYTLLLLGFALCMAQRVAGQAQDDSIRITHRLTAAKVYRTSVLLTHEADTTLPVGVHKLVFSGLAETLDPTSLRIKGTGAGIIQSINHRVNYLDPPARTARQRTLLDSLSYLQSEIARLDDETQTQTELLEILEHNQNLSVLRGGFSLGQLDSALVLFAARAAAIKTRRRTLKNELAQYQATHDRILAEVGELASRKGKPTQEAIVVFRAEKKTPLTLELTYTASGAGWSPNYNLRASTDNDSIQLELNAGLVNKTGLAWEELPLILTTSDGTAPGELPYMLPVFITNTPQRKQDKSRTGSPRTAAYTRSAGANIVGGYVFDEDGKAVVGATVTVINKSTSQVITGVYTDVGGYYQFSLSNPSAVNIKVSYIGYTDVVISGDSDAKAFTVYLEPGVSGTEEVVVSGYSSNYTGALGGRATGLSPSPAKPSSAYVDLSERPLSTEYTIDLPYTVPSDGEVRELSLQAWQLPAAFRRRAAPVLDEGTFLEAQISGWRQLGVLAGGARVYYDGAFLAQTFLNPSESNDTLTVGLGQDPRVRVRREKVRELSSSKLIGSTHRYTFSYRIRVFNDQPQAVTLRLEDQVPVSKDSRVSVELADGHGALFTKEKGILTWDLLVPARDEVVVTFQYEIRYPKDMTLYGLE